MILSLFFAILAVANGQILQETIQVTTVEGIIEGYASNDGDFYDFYGIPYAMPRVGEDMFKPSTASGPLPGVFHAYDAGIECARPTPNGNVGVVNCLVLNVRTSNVTTPKPVLVVLNGEESNPILSSQYSFKKLIEQDIVIVNLNYRLSVFGFLCLKTEQHPGNAGLKDIILGLQWINRNIAAFGGDHNNVVLMGHGSAAAMAELISLIVASENLIHKVIALSGTALAPWAVSYDPIGAAMTLNSQIGGELESIDNIASFLSYRTLNEISDVLNLFKYTNNTQMFAPCIEDTSLVGALLTDSPINLIREEFSYKDLPFLAGYVTREGTIRAADAIPWVQQMQTNFVDFLPVDLDFGNNEAERAESIRNFYFDSSPINMTSIEGYLSYHGDTMAVVSIIRALRERIRTSVSSVYLIEMGYIGTNNSDWRLDHIPLTGARHGSILNYIFDFDLLYASDDIIANSLVKRIAGFLYTGIPDDGEFTRPEPVTTQRYSYIAISGSGDGGTITQQNLAPPQNEIMTFWDPLYDTYYNAPSSAAGLTGLLSAVLLSFTLLIIV